MTIAIYASRAESSITTLRSGTNAASGAWQVYCCASNLGKVMGQCCSGFEFYMDSSIRVCPTPTEEQAARPLAERTNQRQLESYSPVAKAEIALYKSNCAGFCGLSGKDLSEVATVYITSQADISRALQVRHITTFWSSV